MDLVASSPVGLVVPAGGFHVDPMASVPYAVVTHPQQTRAADLQGEIVCTEAVAPLARRRWPHATVRPLAYGEPLKRGRLVVSLHPSGHALGAAQVRLASDTGVTVLSGAYKREADPTCLPFEALAADTFVADATFALPIFHWPATAAVMAEVQAWWDTGREAGRPSILFASAPSIALRILNGLAPRGAAIHVHAGLQDAVDLYRAHGVALPDTRPLSPRASGRGLAGALVVAPLAESAKAGTRRLPGASMALASGLVQLRGARRRHAVDRGFVISDHADWLQSLATVSGTTAARVRIVGDYAHVLARYLREQGREADVPGPREDA
jgi:putative mRNA 3-end processing factor